MDRARPDPQPLRIPGGVALQVPRRSSLPEAPGRGLVGPMSVPDPFTDEDRARDDLAERLEQHADWIENPTLDMASAPEMKADLREAAEALREPASTRVREEGGLDPLADCLEGLARRAEHGDWRASGWGARDWSFKRAWYGAASAFRHAAQLAREPASGVREDDEARVEMLDETIRRVFGILNDPEIPHNLARVMSRDKLRPLLRPAPTTLKGEDE